MAADTNSDQASTEASPFLRLPRELRDEIYADVFVAQSPIELLPTQNRVKPGLLYANRQISAEGLPIFYAGNTFSSTSGADVYGNERTLAAWLEMLPKSERAMIQRVRLYESNEGCEASGKRSLWGVDTWACKAYAQVIVRLEQLNKGFVLQGLRADALRVPVWKDGNGVWTSIRDLCSEVEVFRAGQTPWYQI